MLITLGYAYGYVGLFLFVRTLEIAYKELGEFICLMLVAMLCVGDENHNSCLANLIT